MKKYTTIIAIVIMCIGSSAYAQKINKKLVPSLIINNFQREFPRVFDVEWKIENNTYKVEFEAGSRRQDNSVWYDDMGRILKRKVDISKKDLPTKVLYTINSQFATYKVDDVEKITDQYGTTYSLELKKKREEWKVIINEDGSIISKVID